MLKTNNFIWDTYDQYALAILRKCDLYRDILDSPPLKRLKYIRFLGALEFFSDNHYVDHLSSRYAHTVGVAYLMHKACRSLGLAESTEQKLVVAALLHDVGHGPLSHSVEPYFKERFSFGHKHFTARVISGDLFIGHHLRELLADHAIAPQEIIQLITGAAVGAGEHLLQGSINVDTLDGICRSARFFDGASAAVNPEVLLSVAVKPSEETEPLGDEFWKLKGRVYNMHIFSLDWSIFDSMIVSTLRSAEAKVTPDDFLLTDDEFQEKFSKEFRRVADRFNRRKSELLYDLRLTGDLSTVARRREFLINVEVRLRTSADLAKRYIEKKIDDGYKRKIREY